MLERRLAPQTLNNIISTGRAAVRMVKERELPFATPFTLPEVDEQEPVGRPVSLEERRRLLGELREHVWLLNVLLIATMARPAAIVQMRWVQFNFEAPASSISTSPPEAEEEAAPDGEDAAVPQSHPASHQGQRAFIEFKGRAVKSVRTRMAESPDAGEAR